MYHKGLFKFNRIYDTLKRYRNSTSTRRRIAKFLLNAFVSKSILVK